MSGRGLDFGGAQWESPGSPSSATDDRGQGRQIHRLKPLLLMAFSGNVEGESIGSTSFRVEVPDSRLRVNIALIGIALGGVNNVLGGKGITLWLRAVEDAWDTGTVVPITNLWGTGAVPEEIPGYINNAGAYVADPDLAGWGKEFVTAANAIEGTVDYPVSEVTGAGQLVLQVRYTAEAIRFPRDEWDEIRRACGCSRYGGAVGVNL